MPVRTAVAREHTLDGVANGLHHVRLDGMTLDAIQGWRI
jgi:hypothetical protein